MAALTSNPPASTHLTVLLFTDIVGSTELKDRLGTATYRGLLARHNELFETGIAEVSGARIIKHTGDGYFASFLTASAAVRFALRFQTRIALEPWNPQPLATRVGIHIGEVAPIDMASREDVIGLSADLASRLMSLATGGQILLTAGAFNDARQFVSEGPSELSDRCPPLKWMAHGRYVFAGTDEPLEVFEVGIENFSPLKAPPDSQKARRAVSHDQEPTLGWRPGPGLDIPGRPGWVLESKLGEGGFGEVWLGKHSKFPERRVFKFCFNADRLRSFKREITLFRLLRDALGDRPDIAKLYEIKLDEPPFFLESEYTNGGNQAQWAEAQGGIDKVPLPQRLEIVAQVADAVAAAHSVGVLHKDIKPSNILMHLAPDGSATPRLSDFGIGILADRAQLAAHQITETGFTQITENDSSRTGTRMYAPPELMAGKAFTTAGDIYALGVLLYQVAIGDLKCPLGAGWERDVTDKLVREDVAACVDGDPARRLRTATELAERIRKRDQRLAAYERAIAAQKLAARRIRFIRGVTAAGTVLGVLLVLIVVAYFRERSLRQRATDAEQRAKQQQQQAERDADRARKMQMVAEHEAQTRQAQSLIRHAMLLTPRSGGARGLSPEAWLDRASEDLDQQSAQQPGVHSALCCELGKMYLQQYLLSPAEAKLRQSLDEREKLLPAGDLFICESSYWLACTLERQGHPSEAERLYRRAVLGRQRALGDDDPETLLYMLGLADVLVVNNKVAEARPLLRQTILRRLQLFEDSLTDTESGPTGLTEPLACDESLLHDAAAVYQSEWEERRHLVGEANPHSLVAAWMLAAVRQLQAVGAPARAEATSLINNSADLYRLVAKYLRDTPTAAKSAPVENSAALCVINDLANLLDHNDRAAEADALYDGFVAARSRTFGPLNGATLLARNQAIMRLGRTQAAVKLWRELVEDESRALGSDHPQTLDSMHHLAEALFACGAVDDARRYANQAIETGREVLGNNSAFVMEVSALNALIPSSRDVSIVATTKPSGPDEGPLIATVTAVVNKVRYRTGANKPWQFAKVGDTFSEGTEIQTLLGSRLQFKVPPDQTFAVDPFTRIKLERVTLLNGKVFSRVRYDIQAGGVEHDATLIRSPNSTLEVRG